ncbi:MAG: UDP-glucose/GDP-mannose dehydrogenase family protein [Alphaproteobacteria bacterium]|nr:UDP-glucose/GDP-mannose dehydrogenase family protein [Alphaproteobacteria bacterium]
MSVMSLSVIGLGKLGSPFAAVMAAKGFNVIGIDKNKKFVTAINNGIAPVPEPQLQEYIRKGKSRLSATMAMDEAVLNSDISFIIVPTPSGKDGTFNNAYVLDAIKEMGPAIAKKKSRHIIVVTSTVMPGSSDTVIRAVIEKHTGKIVGDTVGYCYNPEFIALGSVVADMLDPDFILIGESDARSGKIIGDIYKKTCGKDTVLHRMNCVNAELTKISINTFVTAKISYANMLTDICERLPGADIDVVTAAVGADSRIGKKYLKGGVAYGGPCFPRDNIALSMMARKLGARVDLSFATDRINDYQTERLVKRIEKMFPSGAHIGIAGMSYKPNTPVIERSAGVALAAALIREGYKVFITDPLAAKPAKEALKGKVTIISDIKMLSAKVDMLLVMTPLNEYRVLSARSLGKRKNPLVIIDCWRIFDQGSFGKKATVLALGRGDSFVHIKSKKG